MADFDAFEPSEHVEEDPAAEFLAREQSELAGLEDFETVDASQNQGFESFGGGEDSLAGLEQYNNFDNAQADGSSDLYAAISQQDTTRAEPEKIRLWREEHQRRLKEKDEREEKAQEEWRQKAKKELDDWYKHHAEQLQKTRENNRVENERFLKERAAEEAFIKDRDEKVPGQAWEKITRLCEFNPKNSKNTKDVSRMRSILLQLKQTPLVR